MLVAIRRIATSGRTVLCTIHAPSFDIFRAFDELTALVPLAAPSASPSRCEEDVDTSLAYYGAIGARAADVLAYVQRATADASAAAVGGAPLPLPLAPMDAPEVNPAVWIMDAFAALAAHQQQGIAYAASREGTAAAALLDSLHDAAPERSAAGALEEGAARPGLGVQFSLLLVRFLRFTVRNRSWVLSRVLSQLFIGIAFGLLYLQAPNNTYAGVWAQCCAPISSVLFACVVTIGSTMAQAVPLRAVFYREHAAGFYAPALYPLALAVAEVPFGAVYLLCVSLPRALFYLCTRRTAVDPTIATRLSLDSISYPFTSSSVTTRALQSSSGRTWPSFSQTRGSRGWVWRSSRSSRTSCSRASRWGPSCRCVGDGTSHWSYGVVGLTLATGILPPEEGRGARGHAGWRGMSCDSPSPHPAPLPS